MKEKITVFAAAVLAVCSCGYRTDAGADALPVVQRILSDTSSFEHAALKAYDSSDKYGTIAVTGPLQDVSLFTERLMTCDIFENIDGKPVPDGLPDFAGEIFAPFYDVASPDYAEYFRAGTTADFREMNVHHAVAAVAHRCSASAWARDSSTEKLPSKMLVLASSLSYAAAGDIEMLFSRAGSSLPVVSPVKALVDKALETNGNIAGTGIWADGDIIASGVYAAAFKDAAPDVENTAEIYEVPDSLSVRERLFAWLDEYASTENRTPLSVLLIDSPAVSLHASEISETLAYITGSDEPEALVYRPLVSAECKVYDALTAVADACYRILRESNGFTHRIAYPQKTEYMIVPSSGDDGKVKYIEMSNVYVQ